MTDEEVVRAVRGRFRICNYLFRLGLIWLFAGVFGSIFAMRLNWDWPKDGIELIGVAFFTAGAALTLAIYRCPVCDRYLSRFRPDKTRCVGCGARVR